MITIEGTAVEKTINRLMDERTKIRQNLREAVDSCAGEAIHHWADCLTGINAQIGLAVAKAIEEQQDAGA